MRLGGPVFGDHDGPQAWAEAVQRLGYRAAYCPVDTTADDARIRAYAEAAHRADIVIAEVGAWSNPMSPDPEERAAALKKCKASLLLAGKGRRPLLCQYHGVVRPHVVWAPLGQPHGSDFRAYCGHHAGDH